ncbi:hypothetical protein Asppvi_008455 [Aspergillus pseudoviridinutans]|uniref:Uncharacterized protein n=1 Tax=Aspergillus pseudoviridinutans TaxID=1517512 RepID=A0A9P3EY04_9EURO|nr:uncharacterized protein Asppvi_008455 [Aspergillus pseudoviridinutans]GIJ89513.1 hypothetical protein Asppvi_008455 [Aspergillus pseudoviridinutans]
MNRLILMVVLLSSNVAVLAHPQDNVTQQARLGPGYGTAEAEYQTSATPQPTQGLATSWAREPMSSKGPSSLWAAISVYQSVIWASGVGTRPQKNMSHPFFPNTTVAASTSSTARIPSASPGKVNSGLNIKSSQSSSLVPTPTETQQINSTLFTGAGKQDLGTTALLGVAVLFSFVWFLWQ